MRSEDHVSETPEPGGDGDDAGQHQRHEGEAPQGGAGWPITERERDLERLGPMTLEIVNVKVNPILVNQQFKRAICHFDPAFDS